MSKIIFLNGCGSSGKTSIAHSIQHLSDELWLTFGIDTFIDMIPYGKQEAYLKFISSQNERGSIVHVEKGSLAQNLFGLMPKFAEMLATSGNNLIIDEVLFDDSSLKAYVESLKGHKVYYIGVFCDLKLMQEREILRRDRCIGLSNDQIDRVHTGLREYDLNVDTSVASPFKVATHILTFVNSTHTPQGFINMHNKLK